MNEIREAVRERYARAANDIQQSGSCCDPSCCGGSASDVTFVSDYSATELAGLPIDTNVSLGCGNPTLLADLHPGETVLDLGSGAGLDVLLSARRVSPGGHAFGLDMTDEMLAVANLNKAKAGINNATFLRGTIENIPLAEGAVDVVISNCVLNLAEDKGAVIREAFRVLRPGGRLAVSDMVEVEPLAADVKARVDAWAGCISGTIPIDTYRGLVADAGFTDVDIQVHGEDDVEEIKGKIASAYIRATKPA